MPDIAYATPRRRSFRQHVWHYLRWPLLIALILVGLSLCRLAWTRWYTAHIFYAAAASVNPGPEPLYDDDPATAPLLLKNPAYEPAHIVSTVPSAATHNAAWEKCRARGRFYWPGECLLAAGNISDPEGSRYVLFVTLGNRIHTQIQISFYLCKEPLIYSSYMPEKSSSWTLTMNKNPQELADAPNRPMRFFPGAIVGNDVSIPFIWGAEKGRIVIHNVADHDTTSIVWDP